MTNIPPRFLEFILVAFQLKGIFGKAKRLRPKGAGKVITNAINEFLRDMLADFETKIAELDAELDALQATAAAKRK